MSRMAVAKEARRLRRPKKRASKKDDRPGSLKNRHPRKTATREAKNATVQERQALGKPEKPRSKQNGRRAPERRVRDEKHGAGKLRMTSKKPPFYSNGEPTMLKRCLAVMVYFFLGFSFVPARANAQVLGMVLNGLADRVDSSIQKAGAVADGRLLQVGAEMYAAIQTAKIAYQESLNQTVESLEKVRPILDELRSGVEALERQTAADSEKALQVARQVSNSLPLSKDQPQLTAWEPQVEFGQTVGEFTIRLTGKFFYASQPDLKPFLIVGNEKSYPTVSTTQELRFSVRRSVLISPVAGRVGYAKLRVVVPYLEHGGIRSLYQKARRDASFDIELVGLPRTPGSIVVRASTARKAKNDVERGETVLPVVLIWGNSRVIPLLPDTTYRVIYDAFDGTHAEFSSPDHSNRYIDVDLGAGGLRISARKVGDIRPPGK